MPSARLRSEAKRLPDISFRTSEEARISQKLNDIQARIDRNKGQE
jgi:hypothetical protein